MNKELETHKCFNCNKTEKEIPLVQLTYQEKPSWICPQCLPVLIHHIDQLKEKLENLK
jgi:hypothetical protein